MTAEDLLPHLQRWFGFAAFRGPQGEIAAHLLGGGSALVLMATGEGKSLCYQLPALVGDGLTVVVSPLIALMDDQVAALRRKGLPAGCIHSQVDRGERERRLAEAQRGALRLLYVTPERFRVPGFLAALQQARVARFCVDEAHCLSQWGHDFRPDYLRLGEVRQALGQPPCLALTATATPAVQQDIREALGLQDARRFATGIRRDNLFLTVHHAEDDEQKRARLLQVLERSGGPAIVYCALIQDLRRLEGELQRVGLQPLVYHGDLSAHERKTQQRTFQQGHDALMLATCAFGMGVDQPDIRAIVHWQIPRTLEAYYQEVGRAGRDGLPSVCELLYREEDLVVQRDFTEWANPGLDFAQQVVQHLQGLGERLPAHDLDDLRAALVTGKRRDGRLDTVLRLLRTAGCVAGEPGRDFAFVRAPDEAELAAWLPADKRQRDLLALLQMVRYATGSECRKAVLHAHFGLDELAGPCGACDVCCGAEAFAARLPPPRPLRRRAPAVAPVAAGDPAPVQRGDWLQVPGLGLCCVQRVHRTGRGFAADVERSSDLQTRRIDLQRPGWTRIER